MTPSHGRGGLGNTAGCQRSGLGNTAGCQRSGLGNTAGCQRGGLGNTAGRQRDGHGNIAGSPEEEAVMTASVVGREATHSCPGAGKGKHFSAEGRAGKPYLKKKKGRAKSSGPELGPEADLRPPDGYSAAVLRGLPGSGAAGPVLSPADELPGKLHRGTAEPVLSPADELPGKLHHGATRPVLSQAGSLPGSPASPELPSF